MKTLAISVFLFFSLSSTAQIINTVAGNGSVGDSGDGGMATAAKINDPCAFSFDSYGNYYFTEVGGNRVRKVTPDGIISTVAGAPSSGFSGDGGPATLAELNDPTGIAIDSLNNIFIVDKLNERVRRVDALTGIISTIAGNGTAGYGGDSVIADTTMLNAPQDICFDHSGNLYLLDGANYRIRKINKLGIITSIAGNGVNGYTGDGGLADTAEIDDMVGICFDTSGNIYFTQRINYVVRKISTLGIITTIAGTGLGGPAGDGGPATNAQLDPERLAFDETGNLYISCIYNYNIRKINTFCIISTIVGSETGVSGYRGDGGLADSAFLDDPIGLAFDPCGNLYIADEVNNRIRKVAFNPLCLNLSANDIQNNESLNIYPIPTNEVINIDNIKSLSTYYIYSIVGTIAGQGALKQGSNSISVAQLPPGIYMMEVVDEEGNKVVKKLVKE